MNAESPASASIDEPVVTDRGAAHPPWLVPLVIAALATLLRLAYAFGLGCPVLYRAGVR